jgi:hypothetical protein
MYGYCPPEEAHASKISFDEFRRNAFPLDNKRQFSIILNRMSDVIRYYQHIYEQDGCRYPTGKPGGDVYICTFPSQNTIEFNFHDLNLFIEISVCDYERTTFEICITGEHTALHLQMQKQVSVKEMDNAFHKAKMEIDTQIPHRAL